eukprot:jgi/Mesvir1/360/Mv18348-RA.1
MRLAVSFGVGKASSPAAALRQGGPRVIPSRHPAGWQRAGLQAHMHLWGANELCRCPGMPSHSTTSDRGMHQRSPSSGGCEHARASGEERQKYSEDSQRTPEHGGPGEQEWEDGYPSERHAEHSHHEHARDEHRSRRELVRGGHRGPWAIAEGKVRASRPDLPGEGASGWETEGASRGGGESADESRAEGTGEGPAEDDGVLLFGVRKHTLTSVLILNALAALNGSTDAAVRWMEHCVAGGAPPPSLMVTAQFFMATLSLSPALIVGEYPEGLLASGVQLGGMLFLTVFAQSHSQQGVGSMIWYRLGVTALVVLMLELGLLSRRDGRPSGSTAFSAAVALAMMFALCGAMGPLPADVTDLPRTLPTLASSLALDAPSLLASLFFALHTFRSGDLIGRFRGDNDAITITAVQLATVTALALCWHGLHLLGLLQSDTWQDALATMGSQVTSLPVAPFLYLGFVSTGACVLLETKALQRVKASTVTLIYTTIPLWGALFNCALQRDLDSLQRAALGLLLYANVLNSVIIMRDVGHLARAQGWAARWGVQLVHAAARVLPDGRVVLRRRRAGRVKPALARVVVEGERRGDGAYRAEGGEAQAAGRVVEGQGEGEESKDSDETFTDALSTAYLTSQLKMAQYGQMAQSVVGKLSLGPALSGSSMAAGAAGPASTAGAGAVVAAGVGAGAGTAAGAAVFGSMAAAGAGMAPSVAAGAGAGAVIGAAGAGLSGAGTAGTTAVTVGTAAGAGAGAGAVGGVAAAWGGGATTVAGAGAGLGATVAGATAALTGAAGGGEHMASLALPVVIGVGAVVAGGVIGKKVAQGEARPLSVAVSLLAGGSGEPGGEFDVDGGEGSMEECDVDGRGEEGDDCEEGGSLLDEAVNEPLQVELDALDDTLQEDYLENK